MPSYVVITDNTGAALGEGPIYRATRWTAASRLDRAARCSFEVPAADPRAHDLLQNKRQAHYYAVLGDGPQEVGTLIIDQIETVVEGRAEPMLRVSGDNLLAELATRSVHGLELYDVETVGATAVSHVWRYGDGSVYYSDLMDAAYDGDGGTVYQIDIGLKDWNYLYVAGATPLSATTLTLTGTSTAASGDIGAQYYNGDGWYDLVITSDGTHDGTRTLGQSGKIAWERPVDQVMTTHDGVEAYWVRLQPTASTTDGLYISEVDVDQDCETLTGLADIMAYAPAGWTVSTANGGYATTKNGAYMQFAGETVLEALTMLAEHTGEHFRLGVGKSIDWLQDDPQENPTDSGVYAVGMAGAADSGNLDACYITELEEMRDSYQQISRIYAKGAGVGNAQVTLAGCTVTPDAGYSIDYETVQGLRYYYLKHDATEAALGRIEAVRTWPEAGQMEADSAHAELAANALYRVAYEHLKRHITPQYAYTLRVAHLEREVWPGETVRVTYRRHRDGERYIDIDGAMVVLGVEMIEDGAGIRTTALEIASTDAWPLEGGDFLVRELRNARRRTAGNGGVGVIGGGGSVETLEDMALNSVIVLDSGQPYPLVYSPSDAGLAAAVAVAGAGDVIWLPAAGFSGGVTIPAGVTVRGRGPATVIAGTVTLGDGAAIVHCDVLRDEDTPDDVVCIVPPAEGMAYAIGCRLIANNATGAGYAVQGSGEHLECYYCPEISAQTAGEDVIPWEAEAPAVAVVSSTDALAYDLWNGQTTGSDRNNDPPAGWELPEYDDSAWGAAVAVTTPGLSDPVPGSTYIAYKDYVVGAPPAGATEGQENLLRQHFTVAPGALGGHLYMMVEDDLLAVYLDGVLLGGPVYVEQPSTDHKTAFDTAVSAALLTPGEHVLAVWFRNDPIRDRNSVMAVSYSLTVQYPSGPYVLGCGIPHEEGRQTARPIPGDRSAWEVATWGAYHASDIAEATPTAHNPWPAASGTAPVSDGNQYVPTDIATQAELDAHAGTPAAHHDPVTLSPEAADILALLDQEIDLEAQAANTVLAGPASGADAKPTFRALVAADLGSGTPDGTKFLRDDLTWQFAATDGGGGGSGAPAGYAETIGDGVNTAFTITHDLDTTDVLVQVYDLDATPIDKVDPQIEVLNANAVQITFLSVPDTDQYRVLVLAVGVVSPADFVDLNDTPGSYSGQGGKYVAVKITEDGLEFL